MTIRFGVAGTGFWAREVHVPGLLRTPGARPVGIWGRNGAEARAIATRFGIEPYPTFEAMLGAVDAVSFALPPDAQATLALDAARAGKHLLLEKPIARSHAASEAIASAAAERGLCTLVFFMRRFVPEVERAVQEAAAGAWTRASVQVRSSALVEGSPYAGSVWRREANGALWDIGPHVLSILIPVLGAVQEVALEAAEAPDCRFVTSHAGGALASVSLTLHAPRDGTSNDYRFESTSSRVVLPDPPLDRPGHYSAAAGELVSNVGSGSTRHRCDAAFGARIVRVLEAIERSRSIGKPVTLTD